MTSPSSGRVGAVQGSQHAATGPEPSSGVGPASHLDEPTSYPRPLRSDAAGYQSRSGSVLAPRARSAICSQKRFRSVRGIVCHGADRPLFNRVC